MNKKNLNCDNKFGKCCNCPGIMSDGGRVFTNYVSSRIYNDDNRKMMGLGDSHSYRLVLQKSAQEIINKENNDFDKLKCKSNKKNKFYIDSSNFNFTDKLLTK
jgi:hypothetical protein